MFAVVYTATQKILIDPMPYEDPGDLYYVWRDYGPIAGHEARRLVGGTDIAELQKANAVIEDAAGVQRFLGGIFSLREGAEPMEIAVTRTSPNFFDLLGVAPALGRGFAPDEIGRAREQSDRVDPRLVESTRSRPRHRRPRRAAAGAAVHGHRRAAAGVRVRAKRACRTAAARRGVHPIRRRSRADECELAHTRHSFAHAAAPRPKQVAAAVDAVGRVSRRSRLQRPRTEAVSGRPEGRRRLAHSPRARRARRRPVSSSCSC